MRSPTLNTTSVGGHYIQAAALAAKSFIAAALTLSLLACASTDTRRSTGETLDDASVASRVKAALIGNAETDGLDIEVEVNRGNVQLNGFTTTSEESALAEQIASNVSGVRDVDNNLEVVDPDRSVGEYIDDKVLLTRINGALVKDPDVSATNVEVEVNRGLVQLGGYVANDSERRAAEAAAKRVDGVRRVINNIGIRANS